MILDNKNTNLKVHEWIAKYTKEGIFSLVTGYFTCVGGSCLEHAKNNKIVRKKTGNGSQAEHETDGMNKLVRPAQWLMYFLQLSKNNLPYRSLKCSFFSVD